MHMHLLAMTLNARSAICPQKWCKEKPKIDFKWPKIMIWAGIDCYTSIEKKIV
jgi:hypothetical protein